MAGHNFAIASACSEFSAALSAGQMFARKSRTDLRSRLRSASDTPSMFWGVEPFMGAREQRVEAYSQIIDGVSDAEQIGRAHSELQSRSDLVCRLLLEKK